jgi:predicted DNA-binding helix-hairpin-helix protein
VNTATLATLIRSSRFDLCHSKCTFDPHNYVYVSKARGKSVRLLKILLSNQCSFDCSYCPNAWRNGLSITPEELANAFLAMKEKGLVDGLFLSSAVYGDPEKVMDDIIRTGELVRRRHKGYVHLKVVPGASKDQIKRALEIANRVSINVETTSQSRMSELSSIKDLKNDIMRRERWISKEVERFRRRGKRRSHTTQLITGVGENDAEIIESMSTHYGKFGVSRVYLSPFTPVKGTPMEGMKRERWKRVVNLYRIDALIRIYGFNVGQIKDILVDGWLPNDDPKVLIAERSRDKLEPIQIPGIGVKAARLLKKGYSFADLKRMGFSLKRASAYVESQTRLSEFVEL